MESVILDGKISSLDFRSRSLLGIMALSHSLVHNVNATHFIVEFGDDIGLAPIIQEELIYELSLMVIEGNKKAKNILEILIERGLIIQITNFQSRQKENCVHQLV